MVKEEHRDMPKVKEDTSAVSWEPALPSHPQSPHWLSQINLHKGKTWATATGIQPRNSAPSLCEHPFSASNRNQSTA